MPCRFHLSLMLFLLPALALAARDPSYQFTAPTALPVLGKVAPQDTHAPIAMESDEMAYDQERGIVIARGNVQVAQGASVLVADQITYFKERELVVAEGNVSMLQPTGDVFFADYADLKEDLKTGVINTFKARLADNSLFAASQAQQVNPAITTMKKVAYTPCNVCETMAPFWQIKAGDATVDQAEERVRYHDATLEMVGVPFAYTPYMSHPTPDATAKSGVLTPEYKSSSNIGTVLKVPYYWRIAQDREVVVTPWYVSSEAPLLQEEYTQLTDHGSYRIRASQTNPDRLDAAGNKISGNQFRGHIYAQGQEDIDEQTRMGFDINRTTDDTYLRRYSFGSQDALFSKAYIETAENRNYALGQGLLIQGLRLQDNPRATPTVLPMLQGYYETPKTPLGLRYHVAADTQSITREEGVDQRRLSLTPGASLPIVTDGGEIVTTTVNLRQDFYNSNDVPITGSTRNFSGTTTRTLPQLALEWRYPLMQPIGDGTFTVEPVVLAIAQRSGGNPAEISNEDNKLVELTDTNLFSVNRMPGLDTVDSGSRMAYGVRTHYFLDQKTAIDGLFGQDYNVDSDTPFPNSTRPGENFSDYIGRVGISHAPYSLAYRYAIDNNTLSTNRDEFSVGYGDAAGYVLNASYRSLDKNRYLSNSKEGQVYGVLPFSDEWSMYGSTQRDLERNIPVNSRGGLIYKNECFNMVVDALRTYSSDRDIAPTTQFTLRVGFKNLGEFGGK